MNIQFQCDVCGEEITADPRTMVEVFRQPDDEDATSGMCICLQCQDALLEDQEGEDWKTE